jgi:AAA domain
VEIEAFDELFHPSSIAGNGQRSACCPAHDDRVNSLSYGPGDNGGIVLTCQAGCDKGLVLAGVGRSMVDIMGKPYCVEEYSYTTAQGELLWVVERWANPKTFKQRQPGPDGSWVWSAPLPADRVLYNMPGIAYAHEKGLTVYVVEGEKDVATLHAHGLVATTGMGGAGGTKWLPQYTHALIGLDVVVVADNDLSGRLHARSVAAALTGSASRVTLMVSPYGNDVSDLLGAGYTVDALQLLPDAEESALYTAVNIKTRKVSWLWPRYIPFSKLTLIEGDPGDGKSVLSLDLAARVSTGTPMPDGSGGGTPMVVIMVSAEDDMDDTIVPRLEIAGANLKLVKLVPHGANPALPFDLGRDMAWLEAAVIQFGAKLVVFDPLTSFLPENTDSHNDASTRRALYPLRRLASTTGAAVVAIRHLNKGAGKALYRGGGSIGFIAAARAAYLVAPHPTEKNLRVLVCQKNNLAAKGQTLIYEILYRDELPYLVWAGPMELTAQEALDGPLGRRHPDDEEKAAFEKIAREYEREFLLDLLADGPMSWKEIAAIGKEVGGFPEINLRRARADVGLVLIGKPGARDSMWAKPAEPTERDDDGQLAQLAHVGEIRADTPRHEQAEQAEQAGHSESLTDEERDELLGAAELACEICQTDRHVARFGKPYWVVRCFPHNPRTYHGGAE